jgi:hypothetical protein
MIDVVDPDELKTGSAISSAIAIMPDDEHGPDYDFEALARKLGQNDPTEWRWKPRANDNGPVKSATRADLFVGFALGAIIGAATLYVLFFG